MWPFLVILIVFPALAYGAVTYWTSDRSGTPTSTSTSSAPAPSSSGDSTAAETPATGAPVSPSATTEQPPAADKSTPVVVFNATQRKGVAASAAAVLTGAGWTSVTSKNYTGTALKTSTVLYASADLETTARAAADALGLTTIALAEGDAVVGLEIVLEADYKS